jgi:hypothetical protein
VVEWTNEGEYQLDLDECLLGTRSADGFGSFCPIADQNSMSTTIVIGISLCFVCQYLIVTESKIPTIWGSQCLYVSLLSIPANLTKFSRQKI